MAALDGVQIRMGHFKPLDCKRDDDAGLGTEVDEEAGALDLGGFAASDFFPWRGFFLANKLDAKAEAATFFLAAFAAVEGSVEASPVSAEQQSTIKGERHDVKPT